MGLIRKLFPVAVVVLGMHRSGTSCLIGSLQNRGLYLGQVHESNRYNRKGNRESPLIVDLNTGILRYNSADWAMPPVHPIKWTDEHVTTGCAIVKSFASASGGHWGFKDPRTLLVLPFWESVLKRYRYFGTVRHPTLVARSLQNRNNKFTIEQGLNLWREYNLRLLDLLRRSAFPVISFDAESDKYVSSVDMA